MNWNLQIAPLILASWKEAVAGNEQLFEENNHEDSVRGYLVAALRKRFAVNGFIVDAPYSRMNSAELERVTKRIMIGLKEHNIVPDILVHRRNENLAEHNCLALEIKKIGNPEWENDVRKLLEMTSIPRAPRSFQYAFGLLLRFNQNTQIEMARLFQGGQEFELDVKTLLLG